MLLVVSLLLVIGCVTVVRDCVTDWPLVVSLLLAPGCVTVAGPWLCHCFWPLVVPQLLALVVSLLLALGCVTVSGPWLYLLFLASWFCHLLVVSLLLAAGYVSVLVPLALSPMMMINKSVPNP
jgi:hypothetical protein